MRGQADRVYAIVRGFGSFPFDMLRYDCCYPALEEHAGRLETNYDRPRCVIVTKRIDRRPPASNFTPARWSSFGWELIHTCGELYEAQELCKAREEGSR